MAAYGLESDPKFGPEVAEKRHAMVAGRLPHRDWPERPMIIVAVNAETGELTPDADSRDAMGTNQMDFATRIPSARFGHAQGKLEAARLTSLTD